MGRDKYVIEVDEMVLERAREVARESALEAGRFLLQNLRTDFRVSKKGRIDLVTEMDLRSEEMIVRRIRSEFPDHRILAEEQGERGESSWKWIIDPLDGTTNYAHGYRFFCVSIALEADGEVLLGAVYDPVTGELFEAAKGEPATLNGKVIGVSTERELGESLLCTGFSYKSEAMRRNLRHFEEFLLSARAVRRDGSAALDLCYLACGRFDGFWEIALNPWDVAAGKLIAERAGARVSRFDGMDCSIYDGEILASNGRIHEQMTELLKSG